MLTLVIYLEPAKMLNATIRVSLFFALFPVVAAAQAQSPASPDTGLKTPPESQTAGIVAKRDTSVESGYAGARRPAPVFTAPVSEQRSGICGGIKRWECAAYGALIGALGGGWVGSAFAPQPKYEESGGILSSLVCVENCGTQKITLYFSLSGAALGGIAGWQVGRK